MELCTKDVARHAEWTSTIYNHQERVDGMYIRPVFDALCSVVSGLFDDEAKIKVDAMIALNLGFDSTMLSVLLLRDHQNCKLN
jgi:hypothetical protein